ncbi:MAG: V-type ATP synthase subunit I [Bacteroides sp.]|nr:V-type ATP synthase subunit I [Bacteroides sp.]
MIAKMKKLTFLVYHKEYDAFLNHIRDLGVIHVLMKSQGAAENSALQESIRWSSRYASAIKFLQGLNGTAVHNQGDVLKGKEALLAVETLQQEDQHLSQRLQTAEKELALLEPWGDFDLKNVKRLHDAGYQIGFYLCSDKQFSQEWIDKYNAVVINRVGAKVYFVTITPNHLMVELDVEAARLPETSLSSSKERLEMIHKEQEQIDTRLKQLAETVIPDLQAAQVDLHAQIEFSKVVLSTDALADNKLMLLEGWAPSERVEEIKHFLSESEVYYEIAEPKPEENVPICLNNKGFFRLFEPIMRLYMLPKYNELDLTPFFAPFFMLFFGLCLGDSGYGLFMLLAVTIYRLIAKNITATMKPVLTLVQLLGVSTMACGLLTGTCFGFNLYEIQLPFFQSLKETISLDNQQMFNLSLILGGVQIIFGMILKAVNQSIQFGFKYAVGTIGWLLILVSTAIAFAAPGFMSMGGNIHLIFLALGGLMAYLYNSPDKNIFVNLGLGLWDSYNMATGLLGDILSYVRLFALGLSGGILASVFNSLAVGMSPDNVIAGPIVMVLIFVIGHAINIFMNVLGAMVHPMRLTFVEFFKNAGYEGGGKEYKPFKK